MLNLFTPVSLVSEETLQKEEKGYKVKWGFDVSA